MAKKGTSGKGSKKPKPLKLVAGRAGTKISIRGYRERSGRLEPVDFVFHGPRIEPGDDSRLFFDYHSTIDAGVRHAGLGSQMMGVVKELLGHGAYRSGKTIVHTIWAPDKGVQKFFQRSGYTLKNAEHGILTREFPPQKPRKHLNPNREAALRLIMEQHFKTAEQAGNEKTAKKARGK